MVNAIIHVDKNDTNMKLNRIKTVLKNKGIGKTWLAKKLEKSFSMAILIS